MAISIVCRDGNANSLTATLNVASSSSVSVTGSSFAVTYPSSQLKAPMPSNWETDAVSRAYAYNVALYNGSTQLNSFQTAYSNYVSNSSTYATIVALSAGTYYTTNYFNSSNPTSRTASLVFKINSGSYIYYDNSLGTEQIYTTAAYNVHTVNLTLNAPPTFNVGSMTFDTNYIYTGLTTASVNVSSLSAKYGGSISEVKLTIGNQSVTRTSAGTLSILLDAVGTFTPTVSVTDSRGQTTTKTLDDITVNGYIAPAVSFTGDRTLSTGVPDDEGTYITVDATFLYTDAVATLAEPSVTMTDSNGTTTTPAVTWYSTRASDGTLSGSVTWSSVARGQTIYGLIPNANTQYSYQVAIGPRDSEGTGTVISQTIASAFYTVDFLAGGHGIAFGKPASETGFECAMPATFEDEVYIDISDYATSGTTDKAIYDAIVSLGWDSDVLVN